MSQNSLLSCKMGGWPRSRGGYCIPPPSPPFRPSAIDSGFLCVCWGLVGLGAVCGRIQEIECSRIGGNQHIYTCTLTFGALGVPRLPAVSSRVFPRVFHS